jgi:hypothetical protein
MGRYALISWKNYNRTFDSNFINKKIGIIKNEF